MVKKIALFLCLALLLPATATADPITDTPCSQDSHTQTAIYKVPAGTYKVYISSDKGSDVVGLYLNQFHDLVPGHCQSIGQNIKLNQQKVYAGQTTISAANEVSWYLKQQSLVPQSISANRTRIFLMPLNLSICIQTSCQIDESHSQQIIPAESNLATNDLVIAYYVDPSADSLQTVNYFADGNYLFSSQTLIPFPKQYQVADEYSVLSTQSIYKSGQTIIRSQKLSVDNSISPSPYDLVRQYTRPYENILRLLGICTGIALLLYICLYIYRRWHEKRIWKYEHGLLMPKRKPYDPQQAFKRAELLNKWLDIKRLIKYLAIFFVCLLIISAFVIDRFTVSGHSMDKTLHNGQSVMILKLPVTFKKLIHGSYIPHRGSIIVAKINESDGSYVSTFGNGKRSMIKRVVGIPGDRVVVQNNVIYVFEHDHGQPLIFGKGQSWSKTVQTTTDHYDINVVLGVNQVFVAGDNRAASMDSRINGPIDAGQIIGVLTYKL